MATTLVDTLEVKNLTNQLVTIYVQPLANSTIYLAAGGNAQLPGQASLEAEESRFDKAQLRQMANNGVVETTALRRSVTVTGTPGTGSA